MTSSIGQDMIETENVVNNNIGIRPACTIKNVEISQKVTRLILYLDAQSQDSHKLVL